ncbi:type II secretion system F family protein [Catenulispora pinisilvae]|uniref:type II secretion system F family protein n=1 Tax=Catenulispora pinisilvae TaxID=2705253 RepID=UPI001891D7AB|nr:type II secretion system F family protein [Catenulispora pinisilvae]
MTYQVLAGALVGLGLFLLIRALVPTKPDPVSAVARIDALRQRQAAFAPAAERAPRRGLEKLKYDLGLQLDDFYRRQGWQIRSLRADLAMTDRAVEDFLATKVLLAAFGAVFGPFIFAGLWALGIHLTVTLPVWLALLLSVLCFFLPDVEVKGQAEKNRRDFRRVLGSYLDLVALNLTGGRGLPEALMTAAEVSDGWALRRIRNTLTDARVMGTSQWTALSRLGDELNIDELKDLGAALALVAEDGAKVRDSLSARAETMRHRELSEIEGQAGAKSQSMLVAQMLIAAGFMVFLMYPAIARVLGSI